MLPVNTHFIFTERTWGKSPAKNCVLTCRIKSTKEREVLHQQDPIPSFCPQSLNTIPIPGESGRQSHRLWCTAPDRILSRPPLHHPPLHQSVKRGRGSRGQPKGLDPPECPPPLAVWCPTRTPLWQATKHGPPYLSSAPSVAPATFTSRIWAKPSAAKRTASATCPSSSPGLSMGESSS